MAGPSSAASADDAGGPPQQDRPDPATEVFLAHRNLLFTVAYEMLGSAADAEEGTRLADAHLGVSDATWAQAREHYDDEQLAALVCLVGLINAANRLAVILHQRGGSYEPGMFAAFVGADAAG